MIFAYDKNRKRVHIDDAIRGEEYYCQTCGEELCIKRGHIKVHHFSHKSFSNCDGWHYDMSEWHSSWQNQFPLENQEVVFEVDGKKHRADVFINNTVIEFQHSKIKRDEFDDRNNFYTSLGFKVIWIIDATDAYNNGDMEKYADDYSWNNSPVSLHYVDKNIDIYIQEFNNIWTALPNYKEMSISNDELDEYACLHHIDGYNRFGPDTFFSDAKNDIYDYEFIDKYISVKFLHDGSFDKNIDMTKRNFKRNDISDEILTPYENMMGMSKYIYCPMRDSFVYTGDECHACIHLSDEYDRCKYRFELLLSKDFDKIINVEYENGKVRYVTISKDKKRYKVKYDSLPKAIFTIKEAFELFPNTEIIRLRNVNNKWKVQINKNSYNKMLKEGKCFGRMQGPNSFSTHFSYEEKEIFNFGKKEWEIIWRK